MPPQPAAQCRPATHLKAVAQALLVTFLWSTSWVLIKLGLEDSLPALTFAGLRYFAAFLLLVPFVLLDPTHRRTLRTLPRAVWLQLAALGVLFYAVAQGALFLSLSTLPAATLSLFLNFSPIVIALLSGAVIRETPTAVQWGGILLSVAGAVVYFLPLALPAGQTLGLLMALLGLLANSVSSLLGRQINHRSGLPPVLVTAVSMGIGASLLLVTGLAVQGVGRITLNQVLIIAWLAAVNTAIAFTLWNNALRTLTAVESSIINSTMVPQIALFAWLFLDEPLGGRQIAGLALVVLGTLVVQLWRAKPRPPAAPTGAEGEG